MEALTISAANLNIIEDNLGEVAKELNGVISNVNYMNSHVTEVETKVESLNNEIQNMMKEIRENTIITNARQSIMYNNQIIDKKFGYYDNVRRVTLSLLDAVKYSTIEIKTLRKLREDILLNNPNYWLTNALASLTSWVLNDKENTYKELNNALRLNQEKTSLFFTLINLKLNRTQTSINWLNKYLSSQNPTKLNKDFVSILDLVSSGIFGDEQKTIVLNKIRNWQRDLESNKTIKDKQKATWMDFIIENESCNTNFHYLQGATKDYNALMDNLYTTSSYEAVLSKLTEINNTPTSNKKIDDILKSLIYEHEEQEQIYQEDNFRNKLLIECNGNKDEADKLYKKQKGIYSNDQDIITLLTNIAIYPERFEISNETQKIAMSLVKNELLNAYREVNGYVTSNEIEISINDFNTKSLDGQNFKDVLNNLETYLNNKHNTEDKSLLILLIFIDIVGLLSIFLTINFTLINILLVIVLIVANIILFRNINNKTKIKKAEKNREREIMTIALTKIFAEITDYHNLLTEQQSQYKQLETYLNNLRTEDYINSNNERNIIV